MYTPPKPADIFAALESAFGNQTAAAAVLGITRQGYSLAKSRDQFSDASAARAAAALNIPASYLVVAVHLHYATDETRPAWSAAEIALRPRSNSEIDSQAHAKNQENGAPNTNYTNPSTTAVVHFLPLSPEKELALDVIRWMMCVSPHIPPDSPRLAYHVSRWNILEKIDREKTAGTFSALVEKCPLIDPAWIPYALAAIVESDSYNHRNDAQPEVAESQESAEKKIVNLF